MVGLCAAGGPDAGLRPDSLIRSIDQAESARDANLLAYKVSEYYIIKNSRFSRPVEALVETHYKRGAATTHKVVSSSGPGLLTRALERLLQEESQMSHGRLKEQSVITSANYDMKLIGKEPVNGTLCAVMELSPKRRSPYLLKGHLWVSTADNLIVKIEGKPPASPSIFAGRPEIVRYYEHLNGFAMAQRSHAVSGTFLFGQSTVDIDYRDYHLITSPRRAR